MERNTLTQVMVTHDTTKIALTRCSAHVCMRVTYVGRRFLLNMCENFSNGFRCMIFLAHFEWKSLNEAQKNTPSTEIHYFHLNFEWVFMD